MRALVRAHSSVTVILNVIWLVLCGLWMSSAYVIAGLICFVLIIAIPFGTESVNIYETPGRGFYWVMASVFWGGLIQVLAGICGGLGGLLTKRSG